jgi:hypothetical protein
MPILDKGGFAPGRIPGLLIFGGEGLPVGESVLRTGGHAVTLEAGDDLGGAA